jgi:integrase
MFRCHHSWQRGCAATFRSMKGRLACCWSTAVGAPFSANKLREKRLHPLLVKLGIPRGGFHAARHGATSALIADGATLAVVQKQLRRTDHASRWESTAM